MTNRELGRAEYDAFCLFLEQQSGIVLGDNKLYLVKSRLAPLMRQFNIDSLTDLVSRSMQVRERALRSAVLDAMTTNETLWFRDTYPFEVLKNQLLPEHRNLQRPLRIWSAASSTGQEAYSIAMSYLEWRARNPGALPHGIEIVGTDISNRVLEQAQQAEYDGLSLARGLSEERKQRFFEALPNNRTMRLKEEVRSLVKFRHLNLLDSYTLLGKFDIIYCRNVLIYFSPEVKRKILAQVRMALQPEGYLLLGASESISGLTNDFQMVRCNPGIVYQRKN
ncbi:chemotaxis protein CheR [Aliidiomarina taiwanensis]|uniref:protein-glutamate O-methyltransferase n=1 Tax=Aliidiomarina taiwanensis TaxID=946228 RepID=A0A432X803_9GAMM|nr:protein-glutamate O-methyltransferase CheR [Aliidiomarina taiwanensis]RUO43011.1 chemotaxis protein CheR [Aliidiomarina taiwanensis]